MTSGASGQSKRGGGIVCAGNWIVDILHTIDQYPEPNNLARISHETHGIGGGAAVVMSNLAGLLPGLPLFPVGCLGQDDYANRILEHCRELEVPTRHLVHIDGAVTGRTHVMNVPGESRTFFYAGGANDLFSDEQVPVEDLADAGATMFYLGYILLLGALDARHRDGSTGAANLLARARAAGMTTCVDLVSSTAEDFAAIVGASLPQIDFLLLNELELSRASGHWVGAGGDAENRVAMAGAAQALIDGGVRRAVVVHTPEIGLWLSSDGSAVWRNSEPVAAGDIVSATGAGDGFCAGVLCGLHRGWDPGRCLELAHRVGRVVLSSPTATARVSDLAGLA